MKEIRLTLRTEDFGAIWASLLDMGISFYVEPGEDAEGPQREAKPSAAAAPSAARPVAKPTKEKPQKGGDAPSGGADRLRQAMARREGPDLPAAFGEPPPKGSDS